MSEMTRVNFKCSVCGKEAWFMVDLLTYVVTSLDIICDECNPVEDEYEPEESFSETSRIMVEDRD